MSAESQQARQPAHAGARAALVLCVFALAGAALVAGIFQLTKARIERNEQDAILRTLNEILPSREYDNDLVRSAFSAAAPTIGGESGTTRVYLASRQNQPVAVIMEAIAPDGYSGAIRLLVGIYANGEIAGVRAVSHRETPGLGDFIDTGRSDWIRQFEGKSTESPTADAWAVKRDGGDFDQLTGATITARAVVGTVYEALVFYRQHKARLLAGTPP